MAARKRRWIDTFDLRDPPPQRFENGFETRWSIFLNILYYIDQIITGSRQMFLGTRRRYLAHFFRRQVRQVPTGDKIAKRLYSRVLGKLPQCRNSEYVGTGERPVGPGVSVFRHVAGYDRPNSGSVVEKAKWRTIAASFPMHPLPCHDGPAFGFLVYFNMISNRWWLMLRVRKAFPIGQLDADRANSVAGTKIAQTAVAAASDRTAQPIGKAFREEGKNVEKCRFPATVWAEQNR